MDKLFFVDKNNVSYQDLLDYVNGVSENNYSYHELFFLDMIRKLAGQKVKSIDDLIFTMQSNNNSIELLTSGTTGEPKKIIHHYRNMVRNIKISNDRFDDVWALFYQPDRMAGYQVLFQALLNKNTLINMFGYNYEQVSDRINKYEVTHMSATPTFFKMISSNGNSFNNIKQITLGGEGSNLKFHKLLKNSFPNAKFINIYASTEAGSLFASKGEYFHIPFKYKNLVKVENDELLIHKQLLGKSGHIHLNDGWYNTGDLVEFKNDHEFCIKGRSANVIKVGGYIVNIEAVENKINNIDFIKLCKVYAKESSVLGNILLCDLVLNRDVVLLEIKQFFQKQLKRFEIPAKINIVKSIELNENGKIKR